MTEYRYRRQAVRAARASKGSPVSRLSGAASRFGKANRCEVQRDLPKSTTGSGESELWPMLLSDRERELLGSRLLSVEMQFKLGPIANEYNVEKDRRGLLG